MTKKSEPEVIWSITIITKTCPTHTYSEPDCTVICATGTKNCLGKWREKK